MTLSNETAWRTKSVRRGRGTRRTHFSKLGKSWREAMFAERRAPLPPSTRRTSPHSFLESTP